MLNVSVGDILHIYFSFVSYDLLSIMYCVDTLNIPACPRRLYIDFLCAAKLSRLTSAAKNSRQIVGKIEPRWDTK